MSKDICCFCQEEIESDKEKEKMIFLGLEFIAHKKCVDIEIEKQKLIVE